VSSPSSRRNPSVGKVAQATKGAPAASRQLRQWQYARFVPSPVTRKRTAPHRQPPSNAFVPTARR